jgi:molybdenum cofactor cytidylyltransferase
MADSRAAPGLSAVVLAAGAATRFGSAKQLFSIAGEPLVRHIVRRAAALVGDHLIVVLGARAEEIEPQIADLPGRRIVHPRWQEGIGSSLAAGIGALPEDCGAALVLLADQAAVSEASLRRLCDAWRADPTRIAAAVYADITGVPAIFPRAFFAGLQGLTGDTGARALIKRHPDRVHGVPLPEGALDIDSPEDARRYAATLASPLPPMSTPADFSAIDSREKGQAACAQGILEKMFLVPLELGGTDNALNCLYVPTGILEAKRRIDRKVAQLVEQGVVSRYSHTPEYSGRSFVPTKLHVKAWQEDSPPAIDAIIDIWQPPG